MELREILKKCDHTLLRQDCRAEEIRALCDQAIRYECASVCIPPCHVAGAKKYVGDRMAVCTVIGFPNGYMTTAAKVFEAEDAIAHGADELDMVINLGMVKDGCWGDVLADIKAVRKVCKGKILKVIIETCLLSEEEKVQLCAIVSASGADYIKTSTGFSTAGATFEDVALLRRCCDPRVKLKAAGGIGSLADAARFIELGADRLGTSRIVKIAMEAERARAAEAEAACAALLQAESAVVAEAAAVEAATEPVPEPVTAEAAADVTVPTVSEAAAEVPEETDTAEVPEAVAEDGEP